MIAIILALVLGSAQNAPLAQDVDLIEVNEVCRSDAEPKYASYTQVILWNWSPDYRRYEVVSWYLVDCLEKMPRKVGKHYECQVKMWPVKNTIVFRAPLYRETSTTHDPERKQHYTLLEEKLRIGVVARIPKKLEK